jgi:hypothetical protein
MENLSDLFGKKKAEALKESLYTKKITAPIYTPHNACPNVTALYNIKKTKKLIKEIDESNISDEDKSFFKICCNETYCF